MRVTCDGGTAAGVEKVGVEQSVLKSSLSIFGSDLPDQGWPGSTCSVCSLDNSVTV